MLKQSLYLITIGALIGSCTTATPEVVVEAPSPHAADRGRPMVHGFQLLGTNPTYLTLTPPQRERYQVVLKASLFKPGIDMMGEFARDQRRSGSDIYTLETEPFILSEFFGTEHQLPPRRVLQASLFRGDYRQPGNTPLTKSVQVRIERILLARNVPATVDPKDPVASEQLYFLFGEGQELFAMTWRQQASDPHHLAKLQLVEGTLTKEQAALAKKGSLLRPKTTLLAGDSQQATGELIVGELKKDVRFSVQAASAPLIRD